MLISLFEEFPTTKNLEKLKLVTWPTKLYLAAPSYREFQQLTSRIKNKHVKEFIYWPILTKNEGYWISPFSRRKALLRIFQELAGKKVPVMLDLELPTTRNPLLYLTQSVNFFSNRKLIQHFIHQYQGDVYLAEYYPTGKRKEQLLQFLGLHYPQPKVKIIKMLYHSLHSFREEFVKQELQKGKREYGHNFLVAYGTMGAGIRQTEPNISVQQLEKDLQIACRCGVGEVVIYRLGGVEGKYRDVLKKFIRK